MSEVGLKVIDDAAFDGPASPSSKQNQRQIGIWLLVCCAMIFSMVVLGGVTRLTGSGLSMVEWNPIFGVIPPLDQAAWEEVFHKYQQSPEYQKKNFHMGLEEFKTIYWFEFAHRLLGRAIGAVFLLPFLYFLVRRKIERPLIPKLVVMFVLGGLQGLLGWYMVKSGLVDDPHVSQYRLTAHLATAVIIYGYMFWVALGLLSPQPKSAEGGGIASFRRYTWAVTSLIFITVLSGGFVAGLKAGYAYNTFPLMGGQWIPEGIFMLKPLYLNFFENIAAVQFTHRLLAAVVFVSIVALWLWARRFELPARTHVGLYLLMGVVMAQAALGISTLLLHVPVPIAATHQGGALALLSLALYINHALRET